MVYGPYQIPSMSLRPTGAVDATANTLAMIHSSPLPTTSIISLECPAAHSTLNIIAAMTSLIHSSCSTQCLEISSDLLQTQWSNSSSDRSARGPPHAPDGMMTLAVRSHLGLAIWEGCSVAWACLVICSPASQMRA